ncbi:MAG: hypothetical protein HQK53_10920 [Oligoflexia bacterium]|nr:hypothetical protein [Oligoflexia bacterium]
MRSYLLSYWGGSVLGGMIVFLLFTFVTFFVEGCSSSNQEKREVAVDTAKIYLTDRKCDDALSVLEDVGRDNKDAKYVQALASAYACRANYSTLVFYGTNLDKIKSDLDHFFGSLTTFTTSLMIDPEDANYTNLQTAINLLLYAGDVLIPSSVERAKVFSSDDAGNINMQALYMVLTQLGKYIFYYGNADPQTGTKGGGSSSNGNPNQFSNGCIYEYNPSNPILALLMSAARATGELGSCTSNATGSPKLLALPNANTTKRMCQGIVLFNTLLDLVFNTVLPADSKALTNLRTTFEQLCSGGTYAQYVGDLCNVKIQSSCETNYATPPESDKLQAYFFLIFEKMFI